MATTEGWRMPVQSKFVFKMVSSTSPLGKWSVHWRWPWKPAAMAPWPPASSSKPSSARRGLPCMRSRPMSVIFVTNFHQSSCLSGYCHSGGFQSLPCLKFSRIHV